MAATEDFTKPSFGNPIDTDLDAIRDNFNFLLMCALNGAVVVPGWTTTVSGGTASEPTLIKMAKGTRAFHFNLTWSGGNVTQIVCQYDDGVSSPSLATVTGGTITLTYDGSNNFTGATTA